MKERSWNEPVNYQKMTGQDKVHWKMHLRELVVQDMVQRVTVKVYDQAFRPFLVLFLFEE